ncbi:MAG TPA: FAD-binding oxidoreductase [Solirubrobacteraceae bacterium]|nr:FAD-binding oxidoreductase [Solirubrobacteraceae bacterium]
MSGAPAMRFWGWGDDAHAGDGIPPHAEEMLARELDLPPGRSAPVALEEVRLGEPALTEAALADLRAACKVRDDREARVLHAAGKSYPDLVRMRAGEGDGAPDAVVLPGSHDAARAVLDACARHGVAVVPFGGGTSVVGGVEPLRGDFPAVVALDLRRLDRLAAVDERSLTAVVEAGVTLPDAERMLGERGLTLGHFPQSYEYATVGGCVATRSAGQASTGYGRIDELVLGVRMVAPAGDVDLAAMPASAAGPDLRELVVGSEGALGVITQAALRVRPRPQERRYEGWMFPSFGEGAEALRALEQAGVAPDVARLSDEEETRLSMALAGTGGVKGALAGTYLRARGVAGGCLAICGWEGSRDAVGRRRFATEALLREHGAVPLGRSPGDAWARGRFHGPYLRDHLIDRGVFVETLETAAQWSGLFGLYRAVGAALRGALGRCLVMCHVSHLYPSGASLYFTFLARAEPDPLGQWRWAKSAATDAIVGAGGTITHHHAVGRDHAPWLVREAGATGVAALRAVKAELDPAGIMNPGKLLPAE